MSALVDDERTLHPLALELNFAAPAVEEVKKGDKTEFWTDILREGSIATTPGQKKKVPFTIVANGPSSSTRRVISFEDIIKGFDAKAFGDVTIPDGHPKPDRVGPGGKIIKGDSALNNTGYVRGLRVVQKDVNLGDTVLKDCHVLQADMGFTEKDAAEKARNGTIPNVSSGIFFDWVRKADDRYFPCALNHVALTKNPWITGLEGFPKMYFGDDTLYQEGLEFELVNLDDDAGSDDNDAKVIWSDRKASHVIARQLQTALNPKEDEERDPLKPYQPRAYYYVEDVTHDSPNLARVEESFRGKTTQWVVPYVVDDDGNASPGPQNRWIEGKTAMIAASDDTGDVMENFARHSQGKLREKLSIALSDLLGEGPAKDLVIEETSTEGQALLRNKANGGVYLADFRDCGGPVFFSESSSWETIKAPGTSTKKETTKVVASTTPTFDLSTPEGRVAERRHRMRQR